MPLLFPAADGAAPRVRPAPSLDPACDRDRPAEGLMANLSPEREAPRIRAPYDRRAERARADDGAHGAARPLVRRPLGPGHAYGGADRGGRPGEAPSLRSPQTPRADAGRGAGAPTRGRADRST